MRPAPARRAIRAVVAAAGLLQGLATAAPPDVQLTEVVRGFSLPVDIRFAPGVTDRMFVVQLGGLIRVASGNQILGTFLDLTGTASTGPEAGVLGLAFHPDYATNRAFYVFYIAAGTGNVTVARYLRSASNPDAADPASGVVLISVPVNSEGHNGGGLHFGPDGRLYITIGDGGHYGDPLRSGQDAATLRGKVLRIAVDGGTGYAIPPGNMFPAGGTCATTGCPEVFHMGLRNPWRFSFDRLTGDHYIGDVGEGTLEEIDHRAAGSPGANFGWGVYEGNNCFNDGYFGGSGACAALASHTRPVITYPRSDGSSVTGGYVYRGARVVGLGGYYLYGDFVSSNLWAARRNASVWESTFLTEVAPNLSTFGQDAAGEVYLANIGNGRIFRFDPVAGAPDPNADADGDGVPSGVEGQEGLEYTVKDNDVFGVARLFAMQQYRDFLGREGDAGGVQNWTSQIDGAAMTRAQVIEGFFDSTEFQTGLPQCTRLYFSFFRRIPDYAGLMAHVARFRAGVALGVIAQDFSSSAEFTNAYGSLDNGQYVDLVYQNVLSRPAEPEGRANWLAQLDAGVMTRGEVMVGFSESLEFRQIIASEVFVNSIYVGMLRRAPEPGGFNNWVAYFDSGASRDAMLQGFLDSLEYHNRFLP